MEADGKAAPPEDVERMRFTFKGDKLLLRGNFANDMEEDCSFAVDTTKTPHQLDFTPPNEKKPIVGIYEVKGAELKVCLRHASSPDGRPTTFATKPDSNLVLIILKRQDP